MFRPGRTVTSCPVCGATLIQDDIDQFGVPVGYSTVCDNCMKYSDIWVNGLRAVQCGDWESPDYESDYGAMTDVEKKEEKQILRTLNKKIFVERWKYKYNHWKEKRLYGEDASFASMAEQK
ncbi:MAG: hypothetical protein IJF50_07670 [Peptococcaceae bacterium]|nr:hypothetical protein [Peptococcaceae bacterium]